MLSGAELHHLARVLRAEPGDEVVVFDGRGQRFLARVTSIDSHTAELSVIETLADEVSPALEVTIACSPPKGSRTEVLVEKLAELGIARWQPLILERTPPSGRPGPGKFQRYERIAEAASKQSGRADLLEIAPPVDLDTFASDPRHEAGVFGSPASEVTLPAHLAEHAAQTAWSCVLGPEGGLTPKEEALLQHRGFVPVRLGATVLRIETAAIAAAAHFAARDPS
ncbi:MAG: RsmE family RNA methyltransferase [Planctomycetota bacterium]